MQHRQDNLLANRTSFPGMVSGQYAFRIRTLSQVVRYFSLLPCLCILSFSSPLCHRIDFKINSPASKVAIWVTPIDSR